MDTSLEQVLNEILRAIVDDSEDAVCCVDLSSGQIVYTNRAAETLLGYTAGDFRDLTLADVIYGSVSGVVTPPEKSFGEGRVCHRDGHLISIRWRLIRVPQETTIAIVFRADAPIQPISRIDRDPLTGLPNRAVFESRLKEAIESRWASFAAVFLDLDGFKGVNDRFGHVVGDRVLRGVAERLVRCLRPADTVARYGGDEFVALLVGVERKESATKAAKRLLDALTEPFWTGGHPMRISASIGIVMGVHKQPDVAATIHAADRAMYRAKSLGRGRYVVFDERSCPVFPAQLQADRSPSPQLADGKRAIPSELDQAIE